MSSTYLSLHYHVVFSTKTRESLIALVWRSRMYEYLGGIVCGLGACPECIGGFGDHVHILMGLNSTHRLSDFMRELKKSSSFWVHEEASLKGFAWQDGYAAFTVSATSREAVRKYITNQEEHHRVKTIREELEEMLQSSGIKYDSKYLD